MGCDTVSLGEWLQIFWRIVMSYAVFLNCFILYMKAVHTFRIARTTYITMQHHIPEVFEFQ